MAAGKYGSGVLLANTVALAAGPFSEATTINIRVSNANATDTNISVAIGSGANPVQGDYISNAVPVYKSYEDTAIACSVGEKVWILSSQGNVTYRVHGYGDQ